MMRIMKHTAIKADMGDQIFSARIRSRCLL